MWRHHVYLLAYLSLARLFYVFSIWPRGHAKSNATLRIAIFDPPSRKLWSFASTLFPRHSPIKDKSDNKVKTSWFTLAKMIEQVVSVSRWSRNKKTKSFSSVRNFIHHFFIRTRFFRRSSMFLKFSSPQSSNVLNLFFSLSR